MTTNEKQSTALKLTSGKENRLVAAVHGDLTEEKLLLIKQSLLTLHKYPRMASWVLRLVWWLHGPQRRREHQHYRAQLAAQRALAA